jgi:osmotically-inducible protein OsmY
MGTDSEAAAHGARPDLEIARDLAAQFEAQLRFSYANIKSVVKNGRVTLEGNLEWHYQLLRAENAALHIEGVVGISNQIVLMPHVSPAAIKAKIENALKRSAQREVERIGLTAAGREAAMHGNVRSWALRA